MKHEAITAAWATRNRLLAEGNKILAEGDTLYNEGNRLLAEGDKRYAESRKLRNEGNRLRAEGYKLLIEGYNLRIEGGKRYSATVIAKHGDKAIINWETGEVEAPQPVACVQDHETDPNEKDAARCGAEPFTDERWCARQAGIDAWADKRNGGE